MREVRRSADALVGMLPYDPKYKKSNTLLSANESPLNVPDEVLDAVIERVRALDFNRYPDPLANALRVAIAEWHGLKAANVLVGNGGDELLYDIFVAWGGPGRSLLTFPPTFSVYETNAVLTNTQVINMPRNEGDWSIDVDRACERLAKGDIDIVVITNPNNPTGTMTPLEDIRRILDASRCARPRRRGVRRVRGRERGQAARRVREPAHLAHLLEGVPLCWHSPGVLPRQPERDQRVQEGAPALFGRRDQPDRG